jgi:hypothetical protein
VIALITPTTAILFSFPSLVGNQVQSLSAPIFISSVVIAAGVFLFRMDSVVLSFKKTVAPEKSVEETEKLLQGGDSSINSE